MLYIDRDLKSYLKRENRAHWLNNTVDAVKILLGSLMCFAILWLMCYVSYLYDYLPYQ